MVLDRSGVVVHNKQPLESEEYLESDDLASQASFAIFWLGDYKSLFLRET